MSLQFLTIGKCSHQSFHYIFFLSGKFIRIFRINCWKHRIQKRILFSVQSDRSFFIINIIQQCPVCHMKFFSSHKQFPFQFKLNNGDCFMHFHIQHGFRRIQSIATFDFKALTGIFFIISKCKRGKRKQIDSISIFQNIQICISCTDTNYIRNAGTLSGCRSHPYNIMISPLNINGMMLFQLVHDFMRSRTSVINIPENMQMIYNQTLNQFA